MYSFVQSLTLSNLGRGGGTTDTTNSDSLTTHQTWGVATTAGNTLVALIGGVSAGALGGSAFTPPSGWQLVSYKENQRGGYVAFSAVYAILNAPSRSGQETFSLGWSGQPGVGCHLNLYEVGGGVVSAVSAGSVGVFDVDVKDLHDADYTTEPATLTGITSGKAQGGFVMGALTADQADAGWAFDNGTTATADGFHCNGAGFTSAGGGAFGGQVAPIYNLDLADSVSDPAVYYGSTVPVPSYDVNAIVWAHFYVGGPPEAAFSANPTSGTGPLTVAFTDESANTPTAWAWDFGDGTTSTAENPSHTYLRTDTYTVQLTASNDSGSDTASTTITVESSFTVVRELIASTLAAALTEYTWNSGPPPESGAVPNSTALGYVWCDSWRADSENELQAIIEVKVQTFPIWGQRIDPQTPADPSALEQAADDVQTELAPLAAPGDRDAWLMRLTDSTIDSDNGFVVQTVEVILDNRAMRGAV